jgi:hypothetical protein
VNVLLIQRRQMKKSMQTRYTEWKEYYECQKKEMEREHKVVVRRLEKLREEIAGPTNI